MTGATLTVDLDALAANYLTLQAEAGVEAAPAVKADGYGLGAAAIADRLWAEGARSFFVARLAEGEALRAALGDRAAQIVVLDGMTPGAGPRLEGARLTPALSTLDQAEAWIDFAGERLPAVLHIDTGMNRLGVSLEEAERLAAARKLRLALVMSHLACADEPGHPLNGKQRERFIAARNLFPDVQASLANSAGVFLGRDFAFDLVRPGICLYGGGPLGRPDARIRPVATLEAPILQRRRVPAGGSVGYGAAFVADAPLDVAILAVGYADGYPRNASPSAFADVQGAPRRLLGRVSMDLVAVDVTGTDVGPGDKVQLLGADVPVDEVALAADTTSYEVLTRLPLRAQRTYRGAV